MWLGVQIWVLLGLVLHFKLGEKCLFELGLLGRADRLASHLPHIELIEQVLVEVISVQVWVISAKVHVFICAICTLMA